MTLGRSTLEQAARALRQRVPESVAGAVSNCGGTNRRRARFAGELAKGDVPDDQFLAIMHSLIFPNGVRKTTAPARCAGVVRELLAKGELVRGKGPIRVLEIAPSAGLDAKSTHALLAEHVAIETYDLADLHTHVLYDRERGLVFDEDGRLLQVDLGRRFVSIHFSYSYRFQRVAVLPKRLRPAMLVRRHPFDRTRPMMRLPLVHPSLRVDQQGSPFRLMRHDVFDPFAERYDLVICMHLLVGRYFDAATIERGIQNLSSALAVGGTMLVGAAEDYRLVRRTGERTFETRTHRELG